MNFLQVLQTIVNVAKANPQLEADALALIGDVATIHANQQQATAAKPAA